MKINISTHDIVACQLKLSNNNSLATCLLCVQTPKSISKSSRTLLKMGCSITPYKGSSAYTQLLVTPLGSTDTPYPHIECTSSPQENKNVNPQRKPSH